MAAWRAWKWVFEYLFPTGPDRNIHAKLTTHDQFKKSQHIRVPSVTIFSHYFLCQNVLAPWTYSQELSYTPWDFQCQNIHYRAQWGTTLSLRAPEHVSQGFSYSLLLPYSYVWVGGQPYLWGRRGLLLLPWLRWKSSQWSCTVFFLIMMHKSLVTLGMIHRTNNSFACLMTKERGYPVWWCYFAPFLTVVIWQGRFKQSHPNTCIPQL